jgi:DNA-binding transcriptional LysR family regulator
MSLKLDDIKYFDVVATTKNVTRASEILGITQPTLSYSIKRLERELGGDLFVRLKNGVELTHLGIEFQQRGKAVLFEWEQAQKIVSDHQSTVTGLYSLGLHPSVALYTLESFLPNLLKKHTGLELTLKHDLSRSITEQIISWNIDFGIVVNPKRHLDLVIKELCKDQVTLFKSKDLKDAKNLIYDPNLNQSQSILKKLKQRNTYNDLISDNLEVVSKLTSLGIGIGVLPTRVAQNYPNLTKVKDAPVYTDRICLAYRNEKQKSLASKTIINAILKAKF